MILVIIGILLNIITFYFDSNGMDMQIVCITSYLLIYYKTRKCNSIEEIFNIGNFSFKLNKNHFLELTTSFLISLSTDKFYTYNFEVGDIIGFVLFSLFIYRFQLFNTLNTNI